MAAISLPLTLAPEVLDALEELACTRRERRNAILFRGGEPARGVYVVRRGSVKLSFNDRVHRRVRAGSIVGLPAVFSGQPYGLTATAVEDCELAFITREQVLEFVRLKPTLALPLLETLAAEVEAVRELVYGDSVVH